MRSLCMIMSVLLLFCAILGGCQSAPPSHNTATPPSTPENDVTGDIAFSSELVSCSVKDNLARIECITPGYDTFDLTVLLYSLTDNKTLCQVELGNDSWETGWLTNGFYAISLTRRIAYLYDTSGKQTSQLSLPAEVEHLSFVMLNEAADTFLLGDGAAAKILLSPVSGRSFTTVAPINGDAHPLGYQDGAFFVANRVTGEVFKIEETAQRATTHYTAKVAILLGMDFGIGSTETNFKIHSPQNDNPQYVPFHSVGETPFATTADTFITVLSQVKQDILTVYNLKSATVSQYQVPSGVQKVCPVSASSLLVLYQEDDGYHLYICDLNKPAKTDTLTIRQTDTAVNEAPPSPPQAETPRGSHIISVPTLCQWPEYPTGCESTAAVMALRYAGESITVARFIDNHLPMSSRFYYQDGTKYGPDPYQVFIGSPRTTASYGCMAPVIEKAIADFLGDDTRITNTTGTSLNDLCLNYIDKDIPVLVWATIAMLDTYPSDTWHLEDGSRFDWPANEHCLLLVGYDEKNYYFNDPYTGVLTAYRKEVCEDRYKTLGKQSLVIE